MLIWLVVVFSPRQQWGRTGSTVEVECDVLPAPVRGFFSAAVRAPFPASHGNVHS
jgi:hypothetical protein